MRISLTCPASLPATQFGGILFLSIHIAKKLSNDGHNVTIYTSDLDFANNAKTFNRNLPIEEKIDNFVIKRSHAFFSIYLFFVNPTMYFQMAKDKHDIIHVIGIRSFQALIAALISKFKKIPLVLSDQGGLTTHPDIKESGIFKKLSIKLQSPFIKWIINQATIVLAANEYEKKIFENFCVPSKIKIVRNGIDLDELKPPQYKFKQKFNIEQNFLLFLGRFHKVKGIDTLIYALKEISDHPLMANTILVIMGADFNYENEMKKLIENLNLSSKIKIIQNPLRSDVLSAYNECKFLVLPSIWELSPLTPLEGFAFKKTVISTTAHGIPYTLKDQENSLLVTPSNYKILSEAIVDLLGNPKKCDKLGNSGYQMVKNLCNSDEMVKNIFKIYKEIT